MGQPPSLVTCGDLRAAFPLATSLITFAVAGAPKGGSDCTQTHTTPMIIGSDFAGRSGSRRLGLGLLLLLLVLGLVLPTWVDAPHVAHGRVLGQVFGHLVASLLRCARRDPVHVVRLPAPARP